MGGKYLDEQGDMCMACISYTCHAGESYLSVWVIQHCATALGFFFMCDLFLYAEN